MKTVLSIIFYVYIAVTILLIFIDTKNRGILLVKSFSQVFTNFYLVCLAVEQRRKQESDIRILNLC